MTHELKSEPVDTGKQHGPVTKQESEEKEYESLKNQLADITKKMEDIAKKYGGELSNIPQTSEYWVLRNQIQSLTEIKKYADDAKLRAIREKADKKKAEIEAKAKQEEAKVDAEAAQESAKTVAAAQAPASAGPVPPVKHEELPKAEPAPAKK